MYTGLFAEAKGLGLGRLLMGTGGDDMLNVDLTYGADCLAALDLRALWRFFRATQRTSPFSTARVARGVFWEGAAAPELRRLARRLAGHVSPAGLERLRKRRLRKSYPRWLSRGDAELARILERRQLERPPADAAPGERSYVLAMRELTQAPLYLLEQDQLHAWTERLAFTLYSPYLDRDLVELSLQMPPEHLIAGGRHKSPLRRLVAERLPSVRMRAKKVDFTQTVHQVLRPHGRDAWRALGGPLMLTDLGLVDPDCLDRLMADYFDGRHESWRPVWLAMATEAWIRARSGMQLTARQQETLT
jgi:asparagine synthetase B (glutamine-hydrolysing)